MVEREDKSIEKREQSPTDRDLLGRLGTRDPAAFALLYDRYAPMAFGAATCLFEDPPVAERVVEQIFLALWRGAPSREPAQTSLWPWLLAQLLRFARASRSASHLRYTGLDSSDSGEDVAGNALGL